MIIEEYKPIGQTTVEFIANYKNIHNIDKISFAGRLDPIAYGKIIILTNDDIHKKKDYCDKDKIYEACIIKNIITDTYDILGIPEWKQTEEYTIPKTFNQKYPPYSSVIIKKYKKPYWYVAKHNLELSENDIPFKNVTIYDLDIIDKYMLSATELFNLIDTRISKINNKYDFRQTLIIDKWKLFLNNNDMNFEINKIRVKCTSGTYIRNIANMMGGCAFDINRISFIM